MRVSSSDWKVGIGLWAKPAAPPGRGLRGMLPQGLLQAVGNGGWHRGLNRIVPQHLFGRLKFQHSVLAALLLVMEFLLLFAGKFSFLFHRSLVITLRRFLK